MITILFDFVNEKVLITIEGEKVYFSQTNYGSVKSEIDGLQLDRDGAIREFPDLENDINWRVKVIERFKQKIKEFATEEDRADYLIFDLRKYGYVPEQIQKEGFRPRKIT
ncbi:hypothetical protein LCGC14_0571190 [marine sediment metagenome]|uniref:Uncharacterized protein n=1 Tax=marine sediment metagenome TaxID=412755 RepID=A0A0F9U5G3_9ZZZZ